MGFFDTVLTTLSSAAAGFVVGGPGGALAGGLGSLTGTPTAAAATAVSGLTAGAITPAVVTALATPTTRELAAIAATTGGPTGFMKNITRTTVQTIDPSGKVVRSTVLKGSPYLMRSDFVILKRTLALIADAEERVPRPRTRGQKAKLDQAHTKGLLEGLVSAGHPTAALLAHHNSND